MSAHTVRFETNPATGQWRGRCPCGWALTGDRDQVQARAATHDLDELETQPKEQQHEPA